MNRIEPEMSLSPSEPGRAWFAEPRTRLYRQIHAARRDRHHNPEPGPHLQSLAAKTEGERE